MSLTTAAAKQGSIFFPDNKTTYTSISSFSVNVKRRVNPSRRADDGWKSVKYQGKLMEVWKDSFIQQTGGVYEEIEYG